MKVILLFQMVKGKGDILVLGEKKWNLYCPCRNRGTVTRSQGDENNDTQWPRRTVDMQWPGQSLSSSTNAERISDVHQQQKKRVTN